MDEVMTGSAQKSWKVIITRALAWGIGCGVGLTVALTAIFYISSRPKGWDKKTLESKNQNLEQFGVTTDGKSRWIWLNAAIQNNSGEDETLAKETRVMEVKSQNGALDSSSFALTRDYFLPAHETSYIALEYSLYCEIGNTTNQCFQTSLGDVGQVVLFDDIHKYEIRITLPKKVEKEF